MNIFMWIDFMGNYTATMWYAKDKIYVPNPDQVMMDFPGKTYIVVD